jgi:hypothetical protein
MTDTRNPVLARGPVPVTRAVLRGGEAESVSLPGLSPFALFRLDPQLSADVDRLVQRHVNRAGLVVQPVHPLRRFAIRLWGLKMLDYADSLDNQHLVLGFDLPIRVLLPLSYFLRR